MQKLNQLLHTFDLSSLTTNQLSFLATLLTSIKPHLESPTINSPLYTSVYKIDWTLECLKQIKATIEMVNSPMLKREISSMAKEILKAYHPFICSKPKPMEVHKPDLEHLLDLGSSFHWRKIIKEVYKLDDEWWEIVIQMFNSTNLNQTERIIAKCYILNYPVNYISTYLLHYNIHLSPNHIPDVYARICRKLADEYQQQMYEANHRHQGYKKCSMCGEAKHIQRFYARHAKCKTCYAKYRKQTKED